MKVIRPILTRAYLLRCCAMVAVAAMVLQAIPALADPEALSDGELEAVSARGFSFPSLSFGKQPSFTNVVPFVPTSGENETDITNIVFALSNTTNVNTAINTCVFAVCENSGASIESNPVTENNLDLSNQVVPAVQNVVSVPTFTNSSVGAPAGLAPPPPSGGGVTQIQHGLTRIRPPLPKFSFGSN